MNAYKRYNHVTNKNSAETTRDTMTTSSPIQPSKSQTLLLRSLKAAAKANDETEKYLLGWPLFSPPKVQLEKCTKCSREFCSSINFGRHTRVHRRTLKIDKDVPKNRDHVAAFWDELMVDEAKTILSLSDVVVEGVTGSSILTALTTWMCKPGYASLPVAYARAGSELLVRFSNLLIPALPYVSGASSLGNSMVVSLVTKLCMLLLLQTFSGDVAISGEDSGEGVVLLVLSWRPAKLLFLNVDSGDFNQAIDFSGVACARLLVWVPAATEVVAGLPTLFVLRLEMPVLFSCSVSAVAMADVLSVAQMRLGLLRRGWFLRLFQRWDCSTVSVRGVIFGLVLRYSVHSWRHNERCRPPERKTMAEGPG